MIKQLPRTVNTAEKSQNFPYTDYLICHIEEKRDPGISNKLSFSIKNQSGVINDWRREETH